MLQPLPLWAADTVLLPETQAILHPKKPADQAFFRDALARQLPFGVLWQQKTGSLARVGVRATVVALKTYRDGRMEADIQGDERFKLVELSTARPLLTGRVTFLRDEADLLAHDNLLVQAQALLERYQHLAQDLDPAFGRDLPETDGVASWAYHAVNLLMMGHEARQDLLEQNSFKARVIKIIDALRQETASLDFLLNHGQTPPRRQAIRLN